jgi:hypothetical protein
MAEAVIKADTLFISQRVGDDASGLPSRFRAFFMKARAANFSRSLVTKLSRSAPLWSTAPHR